MSILIPTTEEQQLLVEFRQQVQQEERRLKAEHVRRFGPPFISVWSPQYTMKKDDERTEWLNAALSLWSEAWWRARNYETIRTPDGTVGIKSNTQRKLQQV